MTASIARWITEPLGADVERSLERLACADGAVRVAVMPDAHLAHDVCVGTVLATRGRIYPAAVGGDIGCGMAAIAFDADASVLDSETAAARVLSSLYSAVPTIKHRHPRDLPDELEARALSSPRLERRRERDGRRQFATLGRGNHFVEFQADESGRLWLMVHSGSRSMGAAIRDHHVRAAVPDSATGLHFLDSESEPGRAYLADHAWALDYAHANRRALVDRVSDVTADLLDVEADPSTLIACHHNHVRSETHFGEELLVHRKGAISADEGEPGIIPGSMGAASFHTSGRGCAEALRSSSHGAGRRMSRTEARRRIPLRALRTRMRGIWYDHRHERRLLDEAPDAYRDIGAVMRAQRELTRTVRQLRPVLVFKGV
jgi:tRNA-splicing ligase RtcB